MSTMAVPAAAAAIEKQLTELERDRARQHIFQSLTGLMGALQGLSEEQWKFVPGPGKWSIGAITEHIIFVHERVLGPVRTLLAEAAAPSWTIDCTQIDAIVIGAFPNRIDKFPAPEMSHPLGKFHSREEAIERLSNAHDGLASFLEATPDLRCHALPAPPLKALTKGVHEFMDGYQWILAATAHAERHTKQILEVRADPGFPAR